MTGEAMPVTNHSIQTVSYMSDAAAAIGARQLLLTYDNVNPHFFVALQHDWDEPAPPHWIQQMAAKGGPCARFCAVAAI